MSEKYKVKSIKFEKKVLLTFNYQLSTRLSGALSC